MEAIMELIDGNSSSAEVAPETPEKKHVACSLLDGNSNTGITPDSSVKKQTAYSLQNKLAILEAVDRGEKRKHDIAKDFGIAQSTLATIVKQREKITMASEDMNPSRKRLRMPRYADMDKALAEWCRKVQSEGVKLNGRMLGEKAKEFAANLNHTKFACSKGWMARFKDRYGISFNRTIERTDLLQHIQKDVELDLSESSDVDQVLKSYLSKNVYCVHAVTLFWGALPSQGFEKLQKVLADKNHEHVTLLMACNMDGTKKLPLRAILKSGQSLMSLMDVKSQCPIQYTYSDSAVLTPEVFIEWIKHLDNLFRVEERRVCFLVNQSDSYPKVKGLKCIRLLHLPKSSPNPCSQGIAQYLKIAYRLELIQRGTAAINDHPEGTPFILTLLDALRVLREIWKSIPKEIVQQAFLKAGFVLQVALDTFASTVVFTPPSLATNEIMNDDKLMEKIKKNFSISSHVQKGCVNLGMQCLHTVDKDLVSKYGEPEAEVDDNQIQDISIWPTPNEASEALGTLKRFFNTQTVSNASDIRESLEVIENSVKAASGQFLPRSDIVMKITS